MLRHHNKKILGFPANIYFLQKIEIFYFIKKKLDIFFHGILFLQGLNGATLSNCKS